MNFAQPHFLWALALLPLIFIFMLWANSRRRDGLARLGDGPLVERLIATVNWRGRRLKRRAIFVALAFLTVALARPQWGSRVQVVEQEGVQLMVVLDVSNSMLAQDLKPNRLTRAKLEVSELMNRLNGDELGLVLFSGASFIQFPLTSDYDTARAFLDNAGPQLISRPGTAIGEAIETAMSGFDPLRTSQKVIVIMTDGEDHAGDAIADPVAAAETAAEDGAIIYTIGFGSAQGEPIPEFGDDGLLAGYKKDQNGEVILSRLDEVTLQQIAAAAGGRYFRAVGGELDSLAADLDKLQAEQLESRFETQQIERYQLFLLVALLCLILRELIPDRKIDSEERAAAVNVGSERAGSTRSPSLVAPTAGKGSLMALTFGLLLLLSGCTASAGQLINDGNEAFAQAQYDEAESAYREAGLLEPESAEPPYNRGNAQYRQESYDDARESLGEALINAAGQLAQFTHYNLGNVAFNSQQWDEAIEAYKEALRIDPDDGEAKYNLELALQQQQEQTQEEQESTQEPEEPEGDQEQQEQDNQQNPDQEGEEEQEAPDGQQQEDFSTPDSRPSQQQTEALTEEQARQLLETIGESSQTLQERLQQIYTAPGGPPEKDW